MRVVYKRCPRCKDIHTVNGRLCSTCKPVPVEWVAVHCKQRYCTNVMRVRKDVAHDEDLHICSTGCFFTS